MKRRFGLNLALGAALAVGTVSVAGCGSLNRAATLGLTTKTVRIPDAIADITVEEQLARKGFPAAKVRCAQPSSCTWA